MAEKKNKSLSERIAIALRGLELLSFGSTYGWNSSGGVSGDPSAAIVGSVLRGDQPPHIEYRRRWEGARSEKAKQEVVEAAERELREWKVREAPPEVSISEAKIIVDDYVGWPAEQVAQARRVTLKFVRDARKNDEKDPDDGRPRKLELPKDDAERREKALALRDRGFTLRQIAMFLGVSVGTVTRDLE